MDADSTVADDYGACFLAGLTTPSADDPANPRPGILRAYLVSGKNAVGETMGATSADLQRPIRVPCP